MVRLVDSGLVIKKYIINIYILCFILVTIIIIIIIIIIILYCYPNTTYIRKSVM